MDEQKIIKYMTTRSYIKDKYVCWDFIMDVYKDEYNFELPEYPVTEVQSEFKNRLVANLDCSVVSIDDVVEGDIIVFSLLANQHAGIMLNKNEFLHLHYHGVVVADVKNLFSNYTIYRIFR